MIAIILAGGYATRLWPLTLDKPKPLLPIVGKPIIDYIIEKLVKYENIKQIIVSTNQKFEQHFKKWQSMSKFPIEMEIDKSQCELEKPGAVKALAEIASKLDDDCIILAGDNIFTSDLGNMIQFFREKKAPIVALYDLKDLDLAKQYSCIMIDVNKRIKEFVEKPEIPKTSLIGTCIYLLPRRTLFRFKEYLDKGLGRDEPGRFIEWLHSQEPVYGYMVDGYWCDIGTLEAYQEANRIFLKTEC